MGVKSGSIPGAIALAQSEATWYVKWLKETDGEDAVLGSTFRPIDYGPDATSLVEGPEPGTGIYTKPKPKPKPQPTAATVPRGAPVAVPATPSPAPEPAPGPGGLIFNPGTGRYVVPALTGAVGGAAILFLMLRFGLFAAE